MNIPRVFHFIWLGPNILPISHRVYTMSWKRFHPDWQSILWTDGDLIDASYRVIFDEVRSVNELTMLNISAYQGAQTWAGRSNIARIEILHQLGGIYLDTDFLCHKPIDILIQSSDFFAVTQDDEFINNAIFGAVPGHPFLSNMISSLQHVSDTTHHCFEIATGPHLFTEMLKGIEGINILPRHLFYPISYKGQYSQRDYESYATHMWAYSWEKRAWLCAYCVELCAL